jgi:hypothetical protein
LKLTLKILTPSEWAEIAEVARLKSFGDFRPASFDRIDFAMLLLDDQNRPVGYANGSALTADTWHMKYVAAFHRDVGIHVMGDFDPIVHGHLRALGFRRVLTHISPENLPALRFTMKLGYRICGYANFANEPLVELTLDLLKE